jgi:hypothetical protein
MILIEIFQQTKYNNTIDKFVSIEERNNWDGMSCVQNGGGGGDWEKQDELPRPPIGSLTSFYKLKIT